MQKTSFITAFGLSGLLCVGAATHHFSLEWASPVKQNKRIVATIENEIEREVKNYKIASTFRRSKEIWGVYDKYQDRLESKDSKKTIKTSLGELILKDGQVVLVSPLSIDGVTHVEMAQLPYEKSKKNDYLIDLKNATKEQKAALARLYAPLMQDIAGAENAMYQDMNCRKNKSKLDCEINLTIQ